MSFFQKFDIVRTGILTASVGVMDEADIGLSLNAFQSHFKGLQWVRRFERRTDTPADSLFGIGIHDERQVAESIMARIQPDNDICNVTYPQPVGSGRDKVLDKIRIRGKPVRGVRRPWLAHLLPHLQVMTVDNIGEPVAPDGIIPLKIAPIHMPELDASDPGVLRPDTLDVL